MRVTIVGAGAIGGTVGACLARSGTPVEMVDADAAHVAAMAEKGLTIQGRGEPFTVGVAAVTPDKLPGPLETVLLAVKAQHTAGAIAAIAPALTPDSTVVSLQNGLCPRIIAAEIGADRTIGALVNFSADYLEPGLISYGGAGTVRIGGLDGKPSSRLDMAAALLSGWGSVEVTGNIWGYLWGKLGYANMLFGTALTDETMAGIIDRYRPLMVELAAEVYEAADREGVRPEPFDNVEPSLYYPRAAQDWERINASLDDLVARRRADQKSRSGIWRDLAVRKRRTEVDEQIGAVLRIGRGRGLPMPLTARLVDMIHELEDGTRQRAVANVDEIDALRRKGAGE
ncbi:MAG TPA: 2-dehydropantoate 2-reductase [Trebonia sp.]|nr:2-dehydropantoate 2-reductase [Trebonia sp.]